MVRECDTCHIQRNGDKVKPLDGRSEYFEVKVGLHHGSALNQLLFIITMDVLA